jgi:hypothetical protein
MIRPVSVLLALWLFLLFIAGQQAFVPKWMLWLDGLGGVLALFGAIVAPLTGPLLRLVAPVALSLGLLALALVGFLTHVHPWLPWCTLFGALSYLAVAIALPIWSPRNDGTMRPRDSRLLSDL